MESAHPWLRVQLSQQISGKEVWWNPTRKEVFLAESHLKMILGIQPPISLWVVGIRKMSRWRCLQSERTLQLIQSSLSKSLIGPLINQESTKWGLQFNPSTRQWSTKCSSCQLKLQKRVQFMLLESKMPRIQLVVPLRSPKTNKTQLLWEIMREEQDQPASEDL